MNHSQTSIFSGISYSYITFIDEYLQLLNNTLYSSLEYLDKETHTLTKEMHTLFSSLPHLLDSDEDFKETYAHKLIDFRGLLENKYRSLNAYKRELSHLTTIYNLKSGISSQDFSEAGLDESDGMDLDFSHISKDCTDFVFTQTDKVARQQRASALLPFVPMRMTKDSYLSYITKSIHYISVDDDPEHVKFLFSILLQLLDGHMYEGFGKDFKDISISLSELTACENEEFFELADLLDETINTCLKAIGNLYKMICTFSNLLIFDSMKFETLCDMHISFYDLYCTLEKILSNSEDRDLFLTTLPERVDELKVSIKTTYTKACTAKDIDPLFALIQTYLSMDLSHMFGFDTEKPSAYTLETQSLFKDFLADIREYLSSLTPSERKLRMQYFISVVPFIMNESTFNNYVMHGFGNTSDPSRNLITAVYLSNVLESAGYFEYLNEDHVTHHNHDHDHDHSDCGCNHDDHSNCDHD